MSNQQSAIGLDEYVEKRMQEQLKQAERIVTEKCRECERFEKCDGCGECGDCEQSAMYNV